ncbi:hypothetical protein CDL26_07235 [Mediterraneibacter gnavus]|uniref:Uncharacterized protein n=1 Tax=Mediterraneibacter gnavus TaxID=33038 RepID=A0A2N5PDD7_MEDGN|nr:hypothetical protein [Mediterraneibacter gnavus]PLT73105.1 hypothetical protein CDL26_07235 [Mediterraneibacter gnavus]
MNHRVRSVLAAVLIMVVSILLPSDFQFENTDRFVKEQSSSIQMTAQYTDGIEKKVLHDNYLRLENPREAISAQSAEQRKSTQRLPMELLLFLIFSLVVCLKRVFFSCIQFYTLPFTRFLCEYDILLEKDGKKRDLAFGI